MKEDDSQNITTARPYRPLLGVAGVLGFLAVLLGAFGSHALAASFTPRQMEIWEIAGQYHLVHAAVLVGLAWGQGRLLRFSGWFIAAGIVLFSGTLYSNCLTGVRLFGMLAPVGGTALMVGWALMLVAALRKAGS